MPLSKRDDSLSLADASGTMKNEHPAPWAGPGAFTWLSRLAGDSIFHPVEKTASPYEVGIGLDSGGERQLDSRCM